MSSLGLAHNIVSVLQAVKKIFYDILLGLRLRVLCALSALVQKFCKVFNNGFQIHDDFSLIRLHVISLFFNIPFELCKRSIRKKRQKLSSNILNEFLEVIEFISQNVLFMFNITTHKKLFGTPMEGKVTPIIPLYSLRCTYY